MYLVVSRWEPFAGREEDFEARGRIMRDLLRAQPGVERIEGFRTEDGGAIAVVGYESEAAYARIVGDENGVFAKAAAQHGLEECARWVRSERGSTVD